MRALAAVGCVAMVWLVAMRAGLDVSPITLAVVAFLCVVTLVSALGAE
jgi:hypothetical protein